MLRKHDLKRDSTVNKIIETLTLQNYSAFKDSFNGIKNVFWNESESKLTHPGEFGAYRESLAKNWLRMYIPERFGVGAGFIISSDDSVSSQCDIVIYDKLKSPKIESVEAQKFYPIEIVCGVGEIKSDIGSIGELSSHLTRLSKFKKMREYVPDPDPYHRVFKSNYSTAKNAYDNIFTFLICNRFNFSTNPEEIDYGGIEQRFKHKYGA